VITDAGSVSTWTDHIGAPVKRLTANTRAPAVDELRIQPSPRISSLP